MLGLRPNVFRLEQKGHVRGLVRVLAHAQQPEDRVGAARALGKLGGTAALEALSSALGDGDATVRTAAARALQVLGDPRSAERLTAALADEDPAVGFHAALALAEIGDARAVRPLLSVAEHPITDNLSASDRYTDSRDARDGLVAIGERAIAPLVSALGDAEVRWEAEAALRGIADRVAETGDDLRPLLEPLIGALGHEDPGVRAAAIRLLAGEALRDPATVDPVITAMADPDSDVRRDAALALGQLRDRCAVPTLIAGLQDESFRVAASSAQALGRIGDPEAVDALVRALESRTAQVRHEAATSLEMLGWQPADDRSRALVAIADEDWSTLVDLGSHAIAPLVDALWVGSYPFRSAAAGALSALGWQPRSETDQALIAVAQGGWKEVTRLGAAAREPLGTLVPSSPKPTWIDVDEVPLEAACALADLGDPRAIAPLQHLFWKACQAEAAALGDVESAKEAYFATSDEGSRTGYSRQWGEAQAAADAAEEKAARAARSLDKVGPEGRDALAEYLDSPYPAVAAAAKKWTDQFSRARDATR